MCLDSRRGRLSSGFRRLALLSAGASLGATFGVGGGSTLDDLFPRLLLDVLDGALVAALDILGSSQRLVIFLGLFSVTLSAQNLPKNLGILLEPEGRGQDAEVRLVRGHHGLMTNRRLLTVVSAGRLLGAGLDDILALGVQPDKAGLERHDEIEAVGDPGASVEGDLFDYM